MFLSTKARLKITENNKLHICRQPGILSWLFLGLSVMISYWIFHRLTENLLTLITCVLGGLMFGLEKLGDWEDFVLDKSDNSAKFTRYNWSERLFFGREDAVAEGGNKSTSSNFLSIKLNEIRHVGVSADLGLFLLLKNGKTTSLSTTNLNREEIQSMRKEINRFINIARIEYLDKIPNPKHNLTDRLIVPSSDSDEDIVLPESRN